MQLGGWGEFRRVLDGASLRVPVSLILHGPLRCRFDLEQEGFRVRDAVRPCAACLALNRNHQLKRSADAASLRVAATQRVATDPSVIVPFRSAEGLERAGHVELFERLKVVTSALITERADRIARTGRLSGGHPFSRLIECQLINPRKMMMIGPYLISFPALCALSKHMPHVNISSQDLNYKDKQNQRATLKEALSNLELAVRPCAACLALNRNHQLKRSADAASLRVAATQRVATDPSVIVPFRSAEGLERAGHVELFERLKVVTSALITERADRIARTGRLSGGHPFSRLIE
ncbi:hypothetical protein VOLCADRAFT_97312 [Volvox carteri f. nagariensis]|uniref:Uncharacterized protein n=1 Tax=Volvox carteri f. nagariensis TaxID=3068 RepID=D8UCF3_VOLCA|nr:uncharacterized protein VOLCADRAFT_97312 [Volvox carteri f. nagariensis]EFJ42541.1 hypothetical protein VOLCADRAFT_97312 [Volvox carteri f. nagariensis]|eukprot:XP_002956397.1 hypothetical protein VOLCADRAFT_97312 [Volvox carteri f. nagariensis]